MVWRGANGVLLVAFAMGIISAAVLGVHGADEAGLRSMLRITARTSLALFLLAFIAAPLRRLWRHGVSAWLLRNRRYIGISLAVSHTYHLLFIVALVRRFPFDVDPGLLYGGGFGYVMIALMAATSNDISVQRLGRRAWGLLHRFGMYTLWIIFASVYLPQFATAYGMAPSAALATAMALRFFGRPGLRSRPD